MKKCLLLITLLISAVLCLCSCEDLLGTGELDYTKNIKVTIVQGDEQDTYNSSIAWFNSSSFKNYNYIKYIPGYKCTGLYNADGVMYFDGNGDRVPDLIFDRDITLTARFEPRDYNFILNSGDRSFDDGSTEKTVDVLYESTIPTFPEPVNNDPAYYFDGYFSEDGTRYSNGVIPVNNSMKYDEELYKEFTHRYNLTAVYKMRSFTVTVDYNDGSMETDSFTVDYGSGVGSLDAYFKDNGSQSISGWSSNPYVEAALPEAITEDTRIYAVWKNYKNVSFILPDGEAHVERIYEDTQNRITLPQLSSPGYTLLGWHITNSLAGNKVEQVHYSNMQDTYWGNWQLTDYAITFNAKGLTLDEMRYYYGDTTLLPTPELKGYSFYGWYHDDPENPFFSIPETLWGDVELTAKLEPNSYLVTLRPDGGQLITNFEVVEYDSSFTLPVPTKEGYNFLGWYDAARDGNKLTNAKGLGLEAWNIDNENTSLYAYWEVKTYVISFNTDGGTSVKPQNYTHGETLTLPSSPKKSGMLFHGWYNEDGTVEYTSKSVVTGSITLHAHWIQSTPIFDSNGLLAIANDPTLNYHLMDDINMGGIVWTPVEEFSGILDGQGFKIYNLTLSDNNTQNDLAFIKSNKGTIRNIDLVDVTYNFSRHTETRAGILTAYNNGLIQNCNVTGGKLVFHTSRFNLSWDSHSRVGIFAGDNLGTIKECYTDTEIEANTTAVADRGNHNEGWDYAFTYIGGIAGTNSGSIIECHADQITTGIANVSQGGSKYPWTSSYGYAVSYVGGISGVQFEGGKIELSLSTGMVSAYYGSFSADYRGAYGIAGGLVGTMNGGVIDRCYASAAVSGQSTNFTGYVGGFVGYMGGGEITNSHTASYVTCSGGFYIGGFAGYINGVVRYCYSDCAGDLSLIGTRGFVHALGGAGTISGCFTTLGAFYESSSGLLDNYYYVPETPTVGIKTEKTPEELMDERFIYDTMYWDESIWVTDGESYPKLRDLAYRGEEAEE